MIDQLIGIAAGFDEMARLNNDLANMQRQAAQQNSELVRLNNELD